MPLLKFLYWSPYFLPILFIPHAIIHYFKQLVQEGYLLKRRQFLNSLSPKVDQHPPNIVGFFHPYCAAGGGGERVLWQSVKYCLERWEYTVCAIYTGDDLTKEEMVNRVKDRFNISLDVNRIDLVHLKRRGWVEASKYPVLTILGQSLGSVLLGYEAIGLLIPDVFIDTMGYSFTYPVVKLLTGVPVVAYVHYPTISAEMIASAQSQDLNAVNNATSIVKLIPGLSYLKLVYYKVFARIYAWTGSFCDQAMLNSSWTLGHISAMWYSTCRVVYPPCDIDSFTSTNADRTLSIVSLAQFRPEKNHALQLHTLATLFQKHPNLKTEGLKLYVMGSVRNDADQKRVDELKELREELNLTNNVEFVVNASYTEIKKYLSTSLIGLHTMKLEHFGISVVELMCSGLITIANDSGGPQMDIIPPKDSSCYPGGYLASTANEYSELIHHVISLGEEEKSKIRKNALEWCSKFSNEEYEKGFEQSLLKFLN